MQYGPQPGMGHGMLQQPFIPVGQSPRLAHDLPYPAYSANMPHPSRPYNFLPQQIPEPMSPRHQGPAVVHNAGWGQHYGQVS